MLESLANLFRRREPVPAANAAPSVAPLQPTTRISPGPPFFQGDESQPVPRWPDKGAAIIAATPEDLIQTQVAIVQKIRALSPLPREDFDRLMLPVFHRYAAWAHLLPASETHHHCGPGGLLRHGLEVCLHVTRKAEGMQVGVDLVPSARNRYSPRWKVAAALAGLLHDIGKPLVDIGAVDEAGLLTWAPQAGSLSQWLATHQLPHYYLYWRPGMRHQRHKVIGASVAREILGTDMLTYLSEGGAEEVVDLLMVAIADNESQNPMSALVHYGDSTSVDLDLAEQAKKNAASGEGGNRSVAARVLSAIRHRVDTGQWAINRTGSPLWHTAEGFFGIFPLIIDGPVEDLRRAGARSLPVNGSDYLTLLKDFHHIDVATNERGETSPTWILTLTPPPGSNSPMPALQVIKFRNPEYLTGALPMPAPADATVSTPFASDRLVARAARAAETGATAPEAPAATAPPATAAAAATTASAPGTTPPAAADPPPAEGATELPDRRNRPDLANANSYEIQQRRAARQSDQPVAPFAEQIEAIETASFEGGALAAVFRALQSGQLRYGHDLQLTHDAVAVRYPGAFEGEAIPPEELLAGFARLDWLLKDVTTDRKVREVLFENGQSLKSVVLVGLPFRALIQLRQEQPDLFVVAAGPAKPPGKGSKATSGKTPRPTKAGPPPAPVAAQEPPARRDIPDIDPTPAATPSAAPPPAGEAPVVPRRAHKPKPPIDNLAAKLHAQLTDQHIESINGLFHYEMVLAARTAGLSGPQALSAPTIDDMLKRFGDKHKIKRAVLGQALLGRGNPALLDAGRGQLTSHPDYVSPGWLVPYVSAEGLSAGVAE